MARGAGSLLVAVVCLAGAFQGLARMLSSNTAISSAAIFSGAAISSGDLPLWAQPPSPGLSGSKQGRSLQQAPPQQQAGSLAPLTPKPSKPGPPKEPPKLPQGPTLVWIPGIMNLKVDEAGDMKLQVGPLGQVFSMEKSGGDSNPGDLKKTDAASGDTKLQGGPRGQIFAMEASSRGGSSAGPAAASKAPAPLAPPAAVAAHGGAYGGPDLGLPVREASGPLAASAPASLTGSQLVKAWDPLEPGGTGLQVGPDPATAAAGPAQQLAAPPGGRQEGGKGDPQQLSLSVGPGGSIYRQAGDEDGTSLQVLGGLVAVSNGPK